MRYVAVFLLLACVPAVRADEATEELKLRQTALQAYLRMGEVLEAKGDRAGAMRAYAKAVELYKQIGKAPAAADAAEAAGARTVDGAVKAALKWLADHQDADGRWDCDDFNKHDPADDKCHGTGGALYDVGVTSLSVLAFLGAGQKDRGEGPYAKTVRTGLIYLLNQQDEDGCFGARASHSFMYNHTLATLAVCEAYWRTRNPRYKKPASRGCDFIAKARNPYLAWRYEPRGGENDTSVTAWCLMALQAGKYGGIDVDPDCYTGAVAWLDKMTDAKTGRTGYNMMGGAPARPERAVKKFPAEKSESMTSAAIFSRMLAGQRPDAAIVQRGAKLCVKKRPRWQKDGSIDLYYWHYATHALFHVGGEPWQAWRTDLHRAVLNAQHTKGARAGSWDPDGAWGGDGGRVYSTAIVALMLQVESRRDGAWGTRPVKVKGKFRVTPARDK